MNRKERIAAIVVTYNRKELLETCLEAIVNQKRQPDAVYIVDNASVDGTDKWIGENGFDSVKNGIDFRYVKLEENIGGSGGFYSGLKKAYEAKDLFDAFWLMDDDGIPETKQLEALVSHAHQFDYLSPVVLSKEDNNRLAFGGGDKVALSREAKDGLIVGAAHPFNGVLFSRHLVEKVGYPIRDMFIWGDEINYGRRCIKAGFIPAMVIDAIHVHPADRQPSLTILGNSRIVVPREDWKLYCYVRNFAYNIRTLSRVRHCVKESIFMVFRYSVYFTFYVFSWRKLKIVYRALWDGLHKNLSRLSHYRNT